jgi:hypothetical protein
MVAAEFFNGDFVIKMKSLQCIYFFSIYYLRNVIKKHTQLSFTLVRIKYNGWLRSIADSTHKESYKIHKS